MTQPSPSLQQWQALYQAASGFKEIGLWEWMLDSDIFGVQNPESGEIGYCCIMGHLREHFALGVYLGAQGLGGYLKIQSGEIRGDPIEVLMLQKCLMASYEDRGELTKKDLELIKTLGLKFRGRQSWPLFRNYDPGYYPWYLTASEAEYLTLALQQATEIALRFKEAPDMLTPPERGLLLVRVPVKEGYTYRWREEWLPPAPLEKKTHRIEIPVDALRRVKEVASRQQGTWECALFWSPEAVRGEGGRPYFPYMCLWVDRRSGLVLNAEFFISPQALALEFLRQFLELLERHQFHPSQIMVDREETFRLLQPVTFELNIILRQTERLRMAEQAKASLLGFLNRGS